LILIGLFAIANVWQARWTRSVEAERDAARGARPAAPLQDWPEWGKVIVGRESGVEPVEPLPAPAAKAPPTAGHGTPAQAGQPAARAPAPRAATPPEPAKELPASTETKHVVGAGQSLSTIAKAHYGSARKELVDALAAYNKLADAGSIRAGQTLLLPPIEKLGIAPR
jgi:nucleoid-associated protein YgaU